MKKLVAILALLIAVPSHAVEIKAKTSDDKRLKIVTNCFHSITKDTKMSMRPLGKLRVNGKVVLVIDGERMVCKVKEMTKQVS